MDYLTPYPYEPDLNPLALSNLSERICVRPPYFALQNLRQANGTLYATAQAELPIGYEQLPMSAAEIGRHAAIAGLCTAALAQRDDQRRYYLAQRAVYTGLTSHCDAPADVQFKADLTHLDKRRAEASIHAYAGSAPLAHVAVRYAVLTEMTFARLFKARVQTSISTECYQTALTGRLERSEDRVIFQVPEVPLEVCAGHFEQYPALPVAALMHQLTRLADTLLERPCHVVKAVAEADDLCWAGEEVVFDVQRQRTEENLSTFKCRASSKGITKGAMELSLVSQ